MHIEHPDALKSWLTSTLEPLCDADPSALSRYVLALLKKEKPVKELEQCMSEQLDVFLGVETKPFLEKLFIVINSEEYLTSINLDEHNTSGTTIGTIASPSTDASENNLQNTEIRECTPPLLEQKAKDNLIIKTDESTPSSVQSGCSSGLPPVITAVVTPLIKTDESTILVKDKETRRRRSPLKSRSRSRSRSYDRSRRSRSRERRLNEREKPVRQFRNKSPPNRRYGGRVEQRPFQRTQRQRSNSGSRSRSGSPDRRKISRSISPTNDDNSSLSQSSKRQRCRDFDEKGYCMRGETCPWDHGVDPVVLEDINNPALISIQGGQNNLRGQQVHGGGGEYNPDAPDLWSRGNTNNNNFGQRGGGGSHRGSYPRGPTNNFRGGPPFPFPINSAATTPLQQRELIPVPTVDGSSTHTGGDNSMQSKRRFEPEDTVAIAEGPTKRKLPMNSRLGPRINAQQNCSLELRKVPRGLNSIAHLNNHFSKFGKIVNIQISYECDPEAAIITFSTHAEANVAYRSTEAVLNNRFIKVFWHTAGPTSDNQIHQNIGGMGKDENLPNRRIYTSQHALNNIPATPVATTTESINKITSGLNSSTTTTISTATSLVNLPAGIGAQQQLQTPAQIRSKHNDTIRAKNELIRKKQEEQHKNAVQLQHGLHKRKHDLLQEHLKQMRSLLDRVEKVEHSDPRRSNFLSTIKGLQSSIDKLRNEIAIDQAQISARMQNPIPVKKSKEQQQKELLDVELELITQQQEGNDTTAIQKRLSDLQRSFGGSARGAYFPTRNVRVKPAPPGSTSVDRRPTTIQIVGFSMDESDSLLGHFKHFGEITKNQLDKTVPSLTISYATRLNAEQAMQRGRLYQEKRLQVTWAVPAPVKLDTITSETENTEIATSAAVELRLEDEEEEEDAESEDRSWRR